MYMDIIQKLNLNKMKKAEEIKHKLPQTEEEWRGLGHVKANEILKPMPLIERLEVLQNAPSSMTPYEHWIRVSKAELMQWYMNAKTTCSCGGHSKGMANENAVQDYLELMKKYNVPTPSSDICHILGVYNGDGSR